MHVPYVFITAAHIHVHVGVIFCDSHFAVFNFSSAADKQERGKGEEWLKCVAVAKIVASRPSKLQSVSDYYRMISPQVSLVSTVCDN